MIAYEKYMSNIKTDGSCWLYPTGSNVVLYKGKKTYILKAIYDAFGKEWDGRTTRVCKNRHCLNPNHLMNRREQFWSNVEVLGTDDCWEWKNARGDYGSTGWMGRVVGAHRIAYMISSQAFIPDGMLVCHTCDNPPCCNPKHLFLGTFQDNIDDRERKGRNHPPCLRGEKHGQHKLTELDVIEIRNRYSQGNESYRSLSGSFGISFGQIRNIIKGTQWGWLCP